MRSYPVVTIAVGVWLGVVAAFVTISISRQILSPSQADDSRR